MSQLKENGKCIIVSAPSGAGKTTLVHHLLNEIEQLSFSISACSREPRQNEINGVDYHFIGLEEFKNKIREEAFIEWEEVYKDSFYGTLKSEIQNIWKQNKSVIFDVDVIGGLNLKREFGEKALSIFILPPSLDQLELRLRSRKTETDEKINIRIRKAKEELSKVDEFDQCIINNDLNTAKQEITHLVKSFLES